MNHFIHGVARAITETFDLPDPIVEIGSYQVEGQEAIANLRALLPDRQYTGVDMRPGPGVDCVANVEALPLNTGSVGTVLALNTFEHVKCFWRGLDEVHRVLRPEGALVLSTPFHFRIHQFPHDYWRFTPAAYETLLERYPSKVIGWHGAKNRPANVWAVAFREARPAITSEQFARYRSLLARYAGEPDTTWTRRLRYRIASLMCGRGPFAGYLDRNQWDSVCLNGPAQIPLAA
ncbi:MAG: class I SAM-dependent methyltransferase [Planctomycetes bacterium]|nr:class I SAM-dependent methyltransferase [Planctomycetota bacterium]